MSFWGWLFPKRETNEMEVEDMSEVKEQTPGIYQVPNEDQPNDPDARPTPADDPHGYWNLPKVADQDAVSDDDVEDDKPVVKAEAKKDEKAKGGVITSDQLGK